MLLLVSLPAKTKREDCILTTEAKVHSLWIRKPSDDRGVSRTSRRKLVSGALVIMLNSEARHLRFLPDLPFRILLRLSLSQYRFTNDRERLSEEAEEGGGLFPGLSMRRSSGR